MGTIVITILAAALIGALIFMPSPKDMERRRQDLKRRLRGYERP